MIDSDTPGQATRSDEIEDARMPEWMKDWGQFIMLLVALGGFYGFIRSDMGALEGRLGDRIDRNAELISRNADAISEIREDISEIREDIAHLEGYIRGRLGDEPG